MESAASSSEQRVLGSATAAVIGAVAVIIGVWMLLVPPGGQPDEHSHLVRSVALVRGADAIDDGVYLLPDRYAVRDPGCYAFDPFAPASCADPAEPLGQDIPMATRADDYPPGAHVVYGLAGALPGLEPVWWARFAGSAIAVALVGTSIVAIQRRSLVLAGALLLAVTPMAWSIMAGVNPSGPATAGAIGLWAGLLASGNGRPPDRMATWLIATGWAALAVSRRDGLVWVVIIVALVSWLHRVDLLTMGRRLGRIPIAVMGAATVVTMAWGATASSRTSQLVVVAPFALAALVALQSTRRRLAGRTWFDGRAQGAVWLGGAALTLVAWAVLVTTRPGGWDTDLTITIVDQTDDNLVEAIGRLGWLDVPLPWPLVFAWLVALGCLVALCIGRRTLTMAAVLLTIAIVSSWTFELLQGNTTGTYWQGRYSLPLLIGIPLILASTHEPADASSEAEAVSRRVGVFVGWTALFLANVAVWAAARRWGVGLNGSRVPWEWDTPIQPVPPVILLAVHAAGTWWLGRVVLGRPVSGR